MPPTEEDDNMASATPRTFSVRRLIFRIIALLVFLFIGLVLIS